MENTVDIFFGKDVIHVLGLKQDLDWLLPYINKCLRTVVNIQ